MISFLVILKSIKNNLPYFLLIAIYFILINLETRNNNNNIIIKKENELSDDKKKEYNKKLRITIPVIPYEE